MLEQSLWRQTGRRSVLAAISGLTTLCGIRQAPAGTPDLQSEWQIFRNRFLTPDGRIVDTGNGGISHSEGQGWGMLFAEATADKASFDLIYAWTSTHLARPDDALHAWRYNPSASNPVSDSNNATDGDIFIAWALARGAQRWMQPTLSAAAAAIAWDIHNKLCLQQSNHIFLLPGVSGFVMPDSINLNLSYYILPAFDALASLAPSGVWAQLRNSGLYLARKGVFGAWSLPPDWLSVSRPDSTLSLAPAWPPRFGFDAIRVPLWLTWAEAMPVELGMAFSAYWQSIAFPYRPAWIDLGTGAYANFAAPSGMAAVTDLTLSALNRTLPAFPTVADAPDYYSAALILLSRIAQAEKGPGRVKP